jgi:MFS family permease
MMVVFFLGTGAASIATGFSATPLQIAVGLFVIGMFAAIYHPVGLAIVTGKWRNTGMRIAVNGVWGNLGVACGALLTGFMIDHSGWRAAFVVPGIVSVVLGIVYWTMFRREIRDRRADESAASAPAQSRSVDHKALLYRVSMIVFLTTAVSGIIFQSTTFALPKIFDERLQGLAASLSEWANDGLPGNADLATMIGSLAFIVFAVASLAQIVVGGLLDRIGPRQVFIGVAVLQILFFLLMPGLQDATAFAVALGFMLGAFGQIPINDYMIGKMAQGEARARVYAIRYVVSFTALAAALPLIAFVYEGWGFDTLFRLLAMTAFAIFVAVSLLPRRMPTPAAATA